MDYSIIDIETDGLIENATKIHCISVHQVKDGQSTFFSTTSYDRMREILLSCETIIGHNIIRYDVPVAEKLLDIKISCRLIDTLGLSWYLFPLKLKHGLEEWGDDLGIAKPHIADWSNLSIEEYIHRCETDVKINTKVWNLQSDYLGKLYEYNKDAILRLCGYLTFKLECAREQEEVKWKLDVERCTKNLEFLNKELTEKVQILRDIMPPTVEYKVVSRPESLYKKDGNLSMKGERWLQLLKDMNLPEHHVGAIKLEVSRKPGNPGSYIQVKSWLFNMGWIPETFKYTKDTKTGEQKKIPQLSSDDDICDSVKKLYTIRPELVALEGLFVARHRIGILEGFLENKDQNGYLKASIKGFTNTLRFQHTVIVNLPTIPKAYWKEIRECLISPEGYKLCGSDMSGLEDNTKRHYMYYFDPKYVEELMEYGFDAHCDIAVLAKKMSRDEEAFYKWYSTKKDGGDYKRILDIYYSKNIPASICVQNSATGYTLEELIGMSDKEQANCIKILKPIRLKNKKVNFAAIYGAGPPKIALTASIIISEAQLLFKVYWKRNKSVKQVSDSCITKTIGTQAWLFNPVSKFWYSLRMEKDKFSTLNQGTGVYCFDTQVRNVRKRGVKICGQFHDEFIFPLLEGTEEQYIKILDEAIIETNDQLRLNIKLAISKDFGYNYAEIH